MTIEFKAKKIFITLDDPDDAEQFIKGLIIARQNNSSEYFPMLIDAVNMVMEPYRMAVINSGQDAEAPKRAGVL